MSTAELQRQLFNLSRHLYVEEDRENFQLRVMGVDRAGLRYGICSVPFGQLDSLGPQIVARIYEGTPWLNGTDMNQKMDRIIEDMPGGENESKRADIYCTEVAKDWKEDLQWVGGHRISMMPSKPDGSGVVINDRRRLVNV